MGKIIKVHTIGSDKVREVTLEEARKILEDIYNDKVGGFVADARTGQVISEVGPEIDEILLVEQMLGGG